MNLGNVMIFGDSYSTYEGYVPEGYVVYYTGHREEEPNICDVNDTWWGRILNETNSTLIQNNSWSGSTIGYTGYNNADCSHDSSFIYRFEELFNEGFFEQNKIDTVFVFGGTNDSWSDAPLGEFKYDNIEEKELFQVLPAISYFAKRMKETFSDARIVFIANTDNKKEIDDAMENACKHYGLCFVKCSEIDKVNGHPTELGMEQIYRQVMDAIVRV